MAKITVTRRIPLAGDPTFEVRKDDKIIKCITFKLNVSEDDIYNEEKNKQEALRLAERLENGNGDLEEIIYQTP